MNQYFNAGFIITGIAVGILGIFLMTKSLRRYRTVGVLIFPFTSAIILFIITSPTSSEATIEYLGKLSGPIAAYIVVALLARSFIEKDLKVEELQTELGQHKSAEAALQSSNGRLNEELGEIRSRFNELREQIETARPQPLQATIDSIYYHPQDHNRTIVIRTGNIRQVRNVDVIVNSENTAMALARIYDPSISGTLRYLDADLTGDGYPRVDWMYDELQEEIARQGATPPVMAGTVFVTPTHRLAERGVKYVFHAAVVKGEIGAGYQPVIEQLDICIQNCYQHFAAIATNEPITTMLFPLLGAGSGKLSPLQAANIVLPQIVQNMTEVPSVRTTYILAWVESHREALRTAAGNLHLEEVYATV